MQILKAGAAHLNIIVALNRAVQELHVEHEPRFFRPFDGAAVTEYFRRATNDSAVTVLLAVDGEKVLGYVLLRVQERVENAFSPPRRFVELEHVAADPASRKRGVASALVDEAFSVAQSLGLGDLELSVWDFNNDARRLFQKMGFTPCRHRLRARRPPESAAP